MNEKNVRARSAINGRYIKLSYAKTHSRITVVEKIKKSKKK